MDDDIEIPDSEDERMPRLAAQKLYPDLRHVVPRGPTSTLVVADSTASTSRSGQAQASDAPAKKRRKPWDPPSSSPQRAVAVAAPTRQSTTEDELPIPGSFSARSSPVASPPKPVKRKSDAVELEVISVGPAKLRSISNLGVPPRTVAASSSTLLAPATSHYFNRTPSPVSAHQPSSSSSSRGVQPPKRADGAPEIVSALEMLRRSQTASPMEAEDSDSSEVEEADSGTLARARASAKTKAAKRSRASKPPKKIKGTTTSAMPIVLDRSDSESSDDFLEPALVREGRVNNLGGGSAVASTSRLPGASSSTREPPQVQKEHLLLLSSCPLCDRNWPASRTSTLRHSHVLTCAASSPLTGPVIQRKIEDLVVDLGIATVRAQRVQREEDEKKRTWFDKSVIGGGGGRLDVYVVGVEKGAGKMVIPGADAVKKGKKKASSASDSGSGAGSGGAMEALLQGGREETVAERLGRVQSEMEAQQKTLKLKTGGRVPKAVALARQIWERRIDAGEQLAPWDDKVDGSAERAVESRRKDTEEELMELGGEEIEWSPPPPMLEDPEGLPPTQQFATGPKYVETDMKVLAFKSNDAEGTENKRSLWLMTSGMGEEDEQTKRMSYVSSPSTTTSSIASPANSNSTPSKPGNASVVLIDSSTDYSPTTSTLNALDRLKLTSSSSPATGADFVLVDSPRRSSELQAESRQVSPAMMMAQGASSPGPIQNPSPSRGMFSEVVASGSRLTFDEDEDEDQHGVYAAQEGDDMYNNDTYQDGQDWEDRSVDGVLVWEGDQERDFWKSPAVAAGAQEEASSWIQGLSIWSSSPVIASKSYATPPRRLNRIAAAASPSPSPNVHKALPQLPLPTQHYASSKDLSFSSSSDEEPLQSSKGKSKERAIASSSSEDEPLVVKRKAKVAAPKVVRAKKAPDMPDFKEMDLKELQSRVAKFGFRLSKERSVLVQQLEACWKAMHPPLPPAEATPKAVNAVKKVAAGDGASPTPKKRKGAGKTRVEMAEEREAAPEAVREIIANSAELYLRILRYEPIHFDEFQALAVANNIRASKPSLMRILDQLCITFYTEDPTNGTRTRHR